MTLECSLNEIDALVRKAARGAGLSWGLAEEAGKATRWLAARDLPGVTVVSDLLEQNDRIPYDALRPWIENGTWSAARGGRLCPLIAGAALADRLGGLAAGRAVRLVSLSHPILVLPLLGRATITEARVVEVAWPGARIRLLPEGPHIDAAREALEAAEAADVRVRATERIGDERIVPPCIRGIAVPRAVWERLNELAVRTYVPASEESRLRGAGAGVRDLD